MKIIYRDPNTNKFNGRLAAENNGCNWAKGKEFRNNVQRENLMPKRLFRDQRFVPKPSKSFPTQSTAKDIQKCYITDQQELEREGKEHFQTSNY